jgi:hypothetical protein
MNSQTPMAPKDATTQLKLPPLWRSILIPIVVLVAALTAWWLLLSEPKDEPAPAATSLPASPAPEPVDYQALREAFYTEEIDPLMRSAESANHEAAERAVVRLIEVFDKYRTGIRPFAEDITSLGTRFGILQRMLANWWYEDERVHAYVQDKFEKHLFSENQFHEDIAAVMQAFREDLDANENRMLGSVRAAVEAHPLPDMEMPDYRYFEEQVRSIILEFSTDRARNSVYQGIATLVLAEVAAIAAHQVIVRIIISGSTTAVTTAAAGGGATAGATATGGAAGTLGGPVGTVIGIGVGLAVGIAVDWWMTDQFQEQLVKDLKKYFDGLQVVLLEGNDSELGLKVALNQFIDDLSIAQTTVVHRSLVGSP